MFEFSNNFFIHKQNKIFNIMIKDVSNWLYFNKQVKELKKLPGYEYFKIKQDYFGRMYFVINIEEDLSMMKSDEERTIVFMAQLKLIFTFIKDFSIPMAELIRIDYKDINTNSRLYILEPSFDYLNFENIKFLFKFIIGFIIFECICGMFGYSILGYFKSLYYYYL